MRYLRFISHIHKSLPQNPSPNFFHTTQNPNPNLLALIQSKLPSFKSSSAQPPAPSEQVSAIVDELSGLTLLEVSDLVEALRDRLGTTEMPPTMMVMMPGMVPGGLKGKGGGAAKKVEEKAEKTVLDVKLEGFDAAAKIKVIKEVRKAIERRSNGQPGFDSANSFINTEIELDAASSFCAGIIAKELSWNTCLIKNGIFITEVQWIMMFMATEDRQGYLLGVMRTKNKKCEAFLYGLSTSRAADVNASHLNYFWQVIEISLVFEDEFIHLMDYLRIVPCIYFQWLVSAARNNLTT
uniref:Large ribosomal subunit protein bL12 oligomerization domain-containing protein n=1 Tax=Quercus lobata TaxID=97700 RepID=A0A7N2M6E0_QUELO